MAMKRRLRETVAEGMTNDSPDGCRETIGGGALKEGGGRGQEKGCGQSEDRSACVFGNEASSQFDGAAYYWSLNINYFVTRRLSGG